MKTRLQLRRIINVEGTCNMLDPLDLLQAHIYILPFPLIFYRFLNFITSLCFTVDL